jgi:neutral ceramidase
MSSGPPGPIDSEIGMLLVRSAGDKKPIGFLSSFALHLDTVGGTKWSADYPYSIDLPKGQLSGKNW